MPSLISSITAAERSYVPWRAQPKRCRSLRELPRARSGATAKRTIAALSKKASGVSSLSLHGTVTADGFKDLKLSRRG